MINDYESYQVEAIKKAFEEYNTPEETQELLENENFRLYENCFTLKQVRKNIIDELKERIEDFKPRSFMSVQEMSINRYFIPTEIGFLELT